MILLLLLLLLFLFFPSFVFGIRMQLMNFSYKDGDLLYATFCQYAYLCIQTPPDKNVHGSKTAV